MPGGGAAVVLSAAQCAAVPVAAAAVPVAAAATALAAPSIAFPSASVAPPALPPAAVAAAAFALTAASALATAAFASAVAAAAAAVASPTIASASASVTAPALSPTALAPTRPSERDPDAQHRRVQLPDHHHSERDHQQWQSPRLPTFRLPDLHRRSLRTGHAVGRHDQQRRHLGRAFHHRSL